jgi:hypothetical protein
MSRAAALTVKVNARRETSKVANQQDFIHHLSCTPQLARRRTQGKFGGWDSRIEPQVDVTGQSGIAL